MNYATWRKCDFQVHTPRDPNWEGPRPIGLDDIDPETDKETYIQEVEKSRTQWAKKFVSHCMDIGLQAVALTDHHEMVMVPYVRKEIEVHKNNDPKFDFWLFPGMELTTSGGKQCLIIFDSDLPVEWFSQVRGKLGIVYADLDESKYKASSVTQLDSSYPDIAQELDSLEGLQGKYIILPNVSQGNQHTVLIKGAHAEFKRMPYVGGYLDTSQTIGTLGPKNRRRLSGKDKKWSTRYIYPIPTSDNRSADFKSLGKNDTWIKLAEPTAESIRQAFLGYQSRLRIEPPLISSFVVRSIEIENSKILGSLSLNLSPEFNSIIGGRGSGKSTFLEYIAFGLGRSCYDTPRDRHSGADRMVELIEDTIVSCNGSVTLNVMQDNAEFQISRSADKSYQPQVIFPDGASQLVESKILRNMFPAVVYCQGELAELGKNAGDETPFSDLLRFVNLEYKTENDQLETNIDNAKNKIKETISLGVRKWKIESEIRRLRTTRNSYKQRTDAQRENLPKLSEDDEKIIEFFDRANEFHSTFVRASNRADQIVSELGFLLASLEDEPELETEIDSAKEFVQHYNDLVESSRSGVKQFKDNIIKKRQKLSDAESNWETMFSNARKKRDAVLEKLGTHRSVTDQIKQFHSQINQIDQQIEGLEVELRKYENLNDRTNEELQSLWRLVNERREKTIQWVREIETLSNNRIKAEILLDGDTREIKEALGYVAEKTHSLDSTRTRELEYAFLQQSPAKGNARSHI